MPYLIKLHLPRPWYAGMTDGAKRPVWVEDVRNAQRMVMADHLSMDDLMLPAADWDESLAARIARVIGHAPISLGATVYGGGPACRVWYLAPSAPYLTRVVAVGMAPQPQEAWRSMWAWGPGFGMVVDHPGDVDLRVCGIDEPLRRALDALGAEIHAVDAAQELLSFVEPQGLPPPPISPPIGGR